METIRESNKFGKWTIFLYLVVAVLSVSCSKDDDGNNSDSRIQLGQLSLDLEGDCNHSSGVVGTDLKITIPYSGTKDDVISRLLVKLSPSSDPTDDLSFNYNGLPLTDGSGTLSWDGCWRFGNNDWFDFELRIETADGTISSPAVIRVNRPNGAN
ncbi:hypothetical protein [Poritiphilus flavus]|uniref:Lipoprotein n=1 Tax=Poritiphilus flavus TaxID=2697053 RepID=A0A6L9E7V6_9FLAO|nr:hypothetical protein [Poritiphilus flavus]NAS10875.1 hypothetical protein [Poritiphilus flavus]